VVGFLATIKGEDRHVLALAESGHGAGKQGDLLDAPMDSPILANDVWARRTARIGTLIGCPMKSPFDHGRRNGDTVVTSVVTGEPSTQRQEMGGMFQASHVEVKLAVYAACAMLKEFNITTDFDNVTLAELRKLRRVRWKDGTRPSFEVYFSRQNCPRCAKLAETLESITGLQIALCWKPRLVKMTYGPARRMKQARPVAAVAVAAAAAPAASSSSDEIIDIEDDDDELGGGTDGSAGGTNTVDLTSDDHDNARSLIDLTHGDRVQKKPFKKPFALPTGLQEGEDDDEGPLPPMETLEPLPEVIVQEPAACNKNGHIPKPLPPTAVDVCPQVIPNDPERPASSRLDVWNPVAGRGVSLDPREINDLHLAASPPPRQGRGRTPVTREERATWKQRRFSRKRAVRLRRRYSVAPIVNDYGESSSEDSITNPRPTQASTQQRAPVSRSNAHATYNDSSSSNEDIPRRLPVQRAATTMPHLHEPGNTRGFEHVRGDGPKDSEKFDAAQQITPPKTPAIAAMGLLVQQEPESPTLQMPARDISSSPDPF
jgi:hypothetical protein